ncbi:hypothetical protein Syn7803US13_3 [Synechococcus phage ACG-2014f]|uniref:Uncharacterized protein n=1 Tax=Synechococcus phage ACG-2014f TaxID=1493511 RepID=A0A0E3G1J4_9CAUD|nr:hypothetical protein Syn7803US13_3 [Synechococcus phage ACG-2014f]AIX31633.1 hypothetical protein Syn7803US42_5 [Synechococcus phage ACG-2014f]AIX41084.1 hypothetical protein Syn7803C11_3 [Synechococcus phage ACG-2014f]
MARKKISQQKNSNRLKPILDNLIGTEKSDDIMDLVMARLKDSEVNAPLPGKVYIYNYYAKTPNLLYDQYPITSVNAVYNWGFVGYNMHLNKVRQYDWNQSATSYYELKTIEVKTALTLPLKYLVQN